MQLDLSPAQERLRDTARQLAEAELAPNAARFEAEERVPTEVFRRLGEAGLMAVATPAELGGSAAGTVAYSLAMTEIARGCAATAVTMAVTNMVGEVIAAFGDEAQRATWCPRLAAGELGAFALSEVDAGSDPGGMRTVAIEDGDEWVLTGTKQWISHGDLSSVLVVWARTDGAGARGLSCFLVPQGAMGLGVSKHEDKMGLRASHTVGLTFDGVRVPKDAMLGPRGAGFRIAMMALDGGRVGIASQALGIATAAYEAARDFLRATPADQVAQFRLADIRTRLDAARLLALRAAAAKERGEPFSREASIAKAFSSETAWWACNEAAEIVGDTALVSGHPIDRCLRDVRVTMIYEGTSEVQRIVISRMELRA
ncbi:MAG: acyl-CoA dehydrogenase family protein [Myxococcales bacterium]|nr:acyl-CoA dehydrogenase family protein [Myxococcales bacterium]